MGETKHNEQFDQTRYRATVNRMKAVNEDVSEKGRRVKDETGRLHPNVDIMGKAPRVSRNAMVPGEGNTYSLASGVSLPVLSIFDTTGSTAHWLEDFFKTAERQYMVLDGVRTRYNPQFATGAVCDTYNVGANDIPVVQVSQFESNTESADQVRLILPASMGNDSSTEDYQLALYYATLVKADIWEMYGLRGYLTLSLDEIGREPVTRSDVRRYLGQEGDFPELSVRQIADKLHENWHFYILQVPTGGHGGLLDATHSWWTRRIGRGRVIQVQEPRLLADVRAALIYATEAEKPTFNGFTAFMKAGRDVKLDAHDLNSVWRMIQVAEEHFSAQAKLPGYHDIPLPGSVFSHFRHAWPTDHPRAGENITPAK